MRRQNTLGRLLGETRGNVAMIFALCAPMILGGAAFTVETGFHYAKQTRLQAIADSAAFAAALENRSGASYSAIKDVATDAAKKNGWQDDGGSIEVNTPPSSGGYTATAVEVKLTEKEPRFFTAIFSSSDVIAKARSVALFSEASNACVLALNPTASAAMGITGNGDLTMDGCVVASNSNASDGLSVWGSASLKADCVSSAGGVEDKGALTLTCAKPKTKAARLADPLKSLKTPDKGTTQSVAKKSSGTTTLHEGYYPSGLDLTNGTFEMEPGTYYVAGGDLKINGNTDLSGSGVTIYLESGAGVSINGNPTIKLSAPTSGDNKGVLFFGDRTATDEVKFNGNADMKLTGNLYFPNQTLTVNGNFGGTAGCVHIIADKVDWKGNAKLKADCKPEGMDDILVASVVKIVE